MSGFEGGLSGFYIRTISPQIFQHFWQNYIWGVEDCQGEFAIFSIWGFCPEEREEVVQRDFVHLNSE